jgi:ABC-2 type transport system permease protein
MPPLSAGELVLGYMAGGVARGLMVGAVILAAEALVLGQGVAHPLWLLVFVTLGAALLSAIGIAAGILSNKFDQIAAITNFIVVPLSFLSGTFYSIAALPPAMAAFSQINPVFYLIDGARHGMIGQSDASPWLGLAVVMVALAGCMTLCWHWLRKGYRLKP